MFFGENLKFLRKRNRYDQAYIANLLQVQPATISAYETGRNDPKVSGLSIIADLFGVTIDDLIRKDLSALPEDALAAAPALPALVEELRREIADLRTLVKTQQALIDVLNNKNINK